MLDRLQRGLSIAGASLAVLRVYPQLVVFPLISMVMLGAMLLGTGGLLLSGHGNGRTAALHLAAILLFYMAATLVSVFFNAALVACVHAALEGRPVALGAGLAVAASRLPQILGWTLFAGTLGLVIAMAGDLLRRLGILGAVIGVGAPIGWGVMTFLVVPVLVMEGPGPLRCLERCVRLIRADWGEALGVETGVGLLHALALVPVLLVVLAAAAAQVPLVVALVPGALFLPVALGGIAALDMIYRTAVYLHAATGALPPAIGGRLARGALK